MTDTPTLATSTDQYADLQSIADRAAARPFLLSDCEGEMKVWAEAALTHVTRDESGTVTGWSEPSSYTSADLVVTVELDMGTWDPGEDIDDDQRRQDINDLVDAREALPGLLARIADLEAAAAKTTSSQQNSDGDFFVPGVLYQCGSAPETPPENLLLFRAESVAANPATGVLSAFGWIRTQADGDEWAPTVLLQRQFADWTQSPWRALLPPDGVTLDQAVTELTHTERVESLLDEVLNTPEEPRP